MSNRMKNRMLAAAVAAALVEFVIIIALLLPSPAGKPPETRIRQVSARPVNVTVDRGKIMGRQAANRAPDQEEEAEEDASEEAEAEMEMQDAVEPEEEETVEEKKKPKGELSAPEILAETDIVAHGLGSIGGLTQLNCREAFRLAYANGVRVFEVDLRLTRDCQVVLRHDWWPSTWQDGISWANIPTLEKFLSEKILNKYTPMSFRDLLLLMEQYPDICVITDSKFTESDIFTIQFDAMLADAHELGLTYLFDRMFIQIYSGNMRTALGNIYPFPHYIYTLYQDEAPFTGTIGEFREKAAYAKERGIEGIAVDHSWWKPEFAAIADEYGISVFVHTINDVNIAKRVLAEGADAVYTDSLRPKHLT